MKVSRPVHLPVSSEVSLNVSQITSPAEGTLPKRLPSPGPYLTRSGSVYLFQIKVPKEIAASGPLIRISIGALSHRKARMIADLMAAESRILFSRARRRRVTDKPSNTDDPADGQIFTGETHGEVVAEMRGYLKAYARMLDNPAQEPTQEELRRTEGIRDLVSLNREIAKYEAGEPHIEVMVSNADLLQQRALAKLSDDPTKASIQTAARAQAPRDEPVRTVEPTPPVIATPQPWTPPKPARDDDGKIIPAFKLDRRYEPRPPSSQLPLSDVIVTYLEKRRLGGGANIERDLGTARMRLEIFMELIGDHPVDTYTPADLQAFLELMQYWPGDNNKRDPSLSAHAVIEGNRDRHLKPLAFKSLKEGYLATIKAAIRSHMTEGDYRDPFAGMQLVYPKTAALPQKATPLAMSKMSDLFRVGVESGFMENIMLPLLGHLTSRRLGLLVHMRGADIHEQFPGVWVGKVTQLLNVDGRWTTAPIKTASSERYFVLHGFLNEIGFVDWAKKQGTDFLFPNLMTLVNPSKSASSYMQRLFKKAGLNNPTEDGERRAKEVFHSLRGGSIEDMRDLGIEERERRMQAGHSQGDDEHDLYGFDVATERKARKIAALPLDPEIDYSVFRGLDFEAIAKNRRAMGRRWSY